MSHTDSELRLRLLYLVTPEDSAASGPARHPPRLDPADRRWGGLKAVIWAVVAILVGVGLGQLQ